VTVTVTLSPAQAKLVRDLLSTYLDACEENAGGGHSGAADARIARAALRRIRLKLATV
jgi:hypothetical protein